MEGENKKPRKLQMTLSPSATKVLDSLEKGKSITPLFVNKAIEYFATTEQAKILFPSTETTDK